ncbi:MAG: DNA helicase RecQ [Planctomycetes bacterium]|nr:DNA helicase RecQ [Planctomycetota bacterium]
MIQQHKKLDVIILVPESVIGKSATITAMSTVESESIIISDEQETRILETVKQFWGFDGLWPLQRQAIQAGLQQRDSMVVMPTGGGKSLCYQIPPILQQRTDIVVSPLISLMKDQVDGLKACGYPAEAIHSHLDESQRDVVFDRLNAGQVRLLFVSPERLIRSSFMSLVKRLGVTSFAIDEAHCISHWGHSFRPEYRQLSLLKERFGKVSVHAYTATATPRVRQDIIEQLHLDDPDVLVGNFDRENLVYRILPRVDLYAQVIEVIRRHPQEAVIVYCISRNDTERLASVLSANGINAAAYHAGMTPTQRRKTQDKFAVDRLDVIVATVAFGMGIDRSNVRCVIHAAMPKSIEHYQQETGRAGRDGLEAECVMLYSAADFLKWTRLFERSAEEAEDEDAITIVKAQSELLRHMQGLCSTIQCRHRALSQYFGQEYQSTDCKACDVCLGESEAMADSTIIARKILSCVARLGLMNQAMGVTHVSSILRGANTEAIRNWRHDQLSTYGLLSDFTEKIVTNFIYQLIDLRLIRQTSGDRPVLGLAEKAHPVLRGEEEIALVDPLHGVVAKPRAAEVSWEGVDRELFEHLRLLRKEIAQERSVPAFVIFGDKTLRSMASIRPTNQQTLRQVHGVGEKKLADPGPEFLSAIIEYCSENNLETDQDEDDSTELQIVVPKFTKPNPQRDKAMKMFALGAAINVVATEIQRAPGTVSGYLEYFIEDHKLKSVDSWVDEPTYNKVSAAIDAVGMDALSPIFKHLKEEIPYDTIRIVAAHLRVRCEAEI